MLRRGVGRGVGKLRLVQEAPEAPGQLISKPDPAALGNQPLGPLSSIVLLSNPSPAKPAALTWKLRPQTHTPGLRPEHRTQLGKSLRDLRSV